MSLRNRVAFEGLYCIPGPWFALLHLIVPPAAYWLLCRLIGTLAAATLREPPPPGAGLVFAAAILLHARWRLHRRHP